MDSNNYNQYLPNSVSPPGDTLLETLETIGMSQAELARRTGRPNKTINEIIKGKAAITPETALQLERVLGIPASFWINRERLYRTSIARKEEKDNLKEYHKWLMEFPIKQLCQYKWIKQHDENVEQIKELLNFFGIASPNQWNDVFNKYIIGYRKSPSHRSNIFALSAWLRKGEIESQNIQCAPYNSNLFIKAVKDARSLTIESALSIQEELPKLCANAGIAVVFTRQLKNTHVSGATRWLSSDKALIQLSLRYKTYDHLWFSFFHEAGHIIKKHGKRKIFINEENGNNNIEENEANQYARDLLIPPKRLEIFKSIVIKKRYRKIDVLEFANELGIDPGIIVGRLQHDGELPFTHLNGIKRLIDWNN
ncbi:MAG: HigA family addiction module antidote protein [Chloroflexi bacterium]|nr:HigA family addiction module antidote protein [Chloroflexota bacterium]